MEKKHAHGVSAFMLDRNDGLQIDRRVYRPVRVAFHLPSIQRGRTRQAPGARREVRQGGLRPQKRASDYRLVAAWSGLLVLIGAGAFALGMGIHNQELAAQGRKRPEPIYYCATGVEMPMYEPCKEMKGQRDI
jgi:hypothetical protein